MKKVKICLKINDYTLNTTGIKDNNILKFQDQDELKTNIIYDLTNNTLIRDNEEITIKIEFKDKKNNIEYYLKKEKYKLNDTLDNYELINKDTSVIIKYQIEKNNFLLELSYKEE